MFVISDYKALYFKYIDLSSFPANKQRVILSSIDYFCRWADAQLLHDGWGSSDDVSSLLAGYYSHLIQMDISQSSTNTKRKNADLFVQWLQTSNVLPQNIVDVPRQMHDLASLQAITPKYRGNYLLIGGIFIIFLSLFYLIARNTASVNLHQDRYYPVDSTKSIRIRVSSSNSALDMDRFSSSKIEFRLLQQSEKRIVAILICPMTPLDPGESVQAFSIPFSSCISQNSDASSVLANFSGYFDVYIDSLFVTRRLSN